MKITRKSTLLLAIEQTVGEKLSDVEKARLTRLDVQELKLLHDYLIRAKGVFTQAAIAKQRMQNEAPRCPSIFDGVRCIGTVGHEGRHTNGQLIWTRGMEETTTSDDEVIRKHLADGTTPPEGEYRISTETMGMMVNQVQRDAQVVMTYDEPKCGVMWKEDDRPCIRPKGHPALHEDEQGNTWASPGEPGYGGAEIEEYPPGDGYESLLPDNSQAVETNQRRIAALSDPERDK